MIHLLFGAGWFERAWYNSSRSSHDYLQRAWAAAHEWRDHQCVVFESPCARSIESDVFFFFFVPFLCYIHFACSCTSLNHVSVSSLCSLVVFFLSFAVSYSRPQRFRYFPSSLTIFMLDVIFDFRQKKVSQNYTRHIYLLSSYFLKR